MLGVLVVWVEHPWPTKPKHTRSHARAYLRDVHEPLAAEALDLDEGPEGVHLGHCPRVHLVQDRQLLRPTTAPTAVAPTAAAVLQLPARRDRGPGEGAGAAPMYVLYGMVWVE